MDDRVYIFVSYKQFVFEIQRLFGSDFYIILYLTICLASLCIVQTLFVSECVASFFGFLSCMKSVCLQ